MKWNQTHRVNIHNIGCHIIQALLWLYNDIIIFLISPLYLSISLMKVDLHLFMYFREYCKVGHLNLEFFLKYKVC